MIIYPAIDIRAGNCVRLYQGKYSAEKVYSDSPYETAQQFLEQGATWLHVVDLDGAKNPSANQAILIQDLLRALPMKIQVGGGIRTEAQIAAYFEAGAQRVVVGTVAIASPQRMERWLKKYGADRIVLACDVSFNADIPYLRTHAWQKSTACTLFDVLRYFSDKGLAHLLCTDISRDGALTGPNTALYQQIKARFPAVQVQASGGIQDLDDIHGLREANLAGAIIGRAVYEQKIDLTEALLC